MEIIKYDLLIFLIEKEHLYQNIFMNNLLINEN